MSDRAAIWTETVFIEKWKPANERVTLHLFSNSNMSIMTELLNVGLTIRKKKSVNIGVNKRWTDTIMMKMHWSIDCYF